MKKVSPCPVCEMEFSSYKEYQLHFQTEHREWQRVLWRTQNNNRQRRRFDQRLLQRMKQDEKVSKTILRQHPAFGLPKGSHTQQEFDQRLEKLQEKMKDSEEK